MTIAAAGVAVTALLAGCGGGEDPSGATASQAVPAAPASPSPSAPEPGAAASPGASQTPAAGAYIDAAQYQADPAGYAAGGDVVLFFNASWCPTCKAADANFSEAAFPAGLTVVSVDYDQSTDLRQRYGVTVQHTFVQIDANGSEVAKWTGSRTVEQVAAKVV